MYYIYETDKPNKILKRLNIIKLIENKIVLPINEENITQKQAEKLAMKTNKILQRTNSKTVLISKKIKKQEYYINYLNSYNIKIIDGKWLNEILSYDILEYITKTKKIKKEETQIAITINEITENMLQNIRKIVKDYKRVNIITNHISNFKYVDYSILRGYLGALYQKKISDNSVSRYLSALRSFFKWLVRTKRIKNNPMLFHTALFLCNSSHNVLRLLR